MNTEYQVSFDLALSEGNPRKWIPELITQDLDAEAGEVASAFEFTQNADSNAHRVSFILSVPDDATHPRTWIPETIQYALDVPNNEFATNFSVVELARSQVCYN